MASVLWWSMHIRMCALHIVGAFNAAARRRAAGLRINGVSADTFCSTLSRSSSRAFHLSPRRAWLRMRRTKKRATQQERLRSKSSTVESKQNIFTFRTYSSISLSNEHLHMQIIQFDLHFLYQNKSILSAHLFELTVRLASIFTHLAATPRPGNNISGHEKLVLVKQQKPPKPSGLVQPRLPNTRA